MVLMIQNLMFMSNLLFRALQIIKDHSQYFQTYTSLIPASLNKNSCSNCMVDLNRSMGDSLSHSSSQTQKHQNTKYIYPKLRNICSKLRNNHENSKILQKNNQKLWKTNKIIINNKNTVMKTRYNSKNMKKQFPSIVSFFHDFCYFFCNNSLFSWLFRNLEQIFRHLGFISGFGCFTCAAVWLVDNAFIRSITGCSTTSLPGAWLTAPWLV